MRNHNNIDQFKFPKQGDYYRVKVMFKYDRDTIVGGMQ